MRRLLQTILLCGQQKPSRSSIVRCVPDIYRCLHPFTVFTLQGSIGPAFASRVKQKGRRHMF